VRVSIGAPFRITFANPRRQETVAALKADLEAGKLGPASPPQQGDLAELLTARGVRVVDFAGWRRIDAEERRRGEAAGQTRCKIIDPSEMLRVALDSPPPPPPPPPP
jgi:ferredoxin--NADP+ reductase